MKKYILRAFASSFIVAGVLSTVGCRTSVDRSFACVDIHKKQVVKVDNSGDVIWSYSAELVHDLWKLPNGNILFAGPATGVVEVSPDKKVVWKFDNVRKGHKIFSCQPLDNGNVLIAADGPKPRVIEVNRVGAIVRKTPVKAKGMGSLRLARLTKAGTILVPARKYRKVHEYDENGVLIREFPVPGDPFLAVRLENGNTLVSCGDGHTIVEVDPNDKIVWQIKENDLPDNPLRFVAGFQRLPNGNTVIVNWGGHGHVGKQPQIFEVTRDKKVVWQVFDNENLSTPSHVQMLDQTGNLYR